MNAILESKEFVSSLAGAFVGALAAFFLNAVYEFKKQRDRKHEAIISAQYALCAQRNDLENILVQMLNPLREHPRRDQMMKRYQYPFTELRVRQSELIFFAAADAANELNDVMIAQSSFLNVILCVERFNRAKEAFHATAEFRGFTEGSTALYGVPRKAIPLANDVREILDHLYRLTDETIHRLDDAIKVLRKVGKAQLPERTFLNYELRRSEKHADKNTSAI